MSLFYRCKRLGFQRSAVTRAVDFIATKATQLVRPFAHSERGGTAVFFAFVVIPLIAFIGLATDATRGYFVKARLNQALDAAALAGGRVFSSPTRDDDIRMYFKANFPDGYMSAVTTPLVIAADDVNKTLSVSAQASVPTTFLRLVNIDTIPVANSTAVTVESQNVEVALVLDITGSMAGQRIIDLRAAANELVDIVVQDQQAPFYSKVALIPYSQAVNVGAYAAQVRGGVAIAKTITGATKANPVVITSVNHGLNNGDKIFISGVGGMTQINNNMTALTTATNSPQFWVVANKTTNTFALRRLDNSNANGTNWGTYTANSGSIHCTSPGCQYQSFQNQQNGSWKTHQISTCVTERAGANAYTDAAPSVSPVGRNYPDSGNPCLASQISPLSSDKTVLHNKINALQASGSTAGQIGIGWGWYMLSPNFSYLWPSAGKPAAYGTEKLLKVAIIMTDGDFNTIYYNGIIAQDATSGSGSITEHVNHSSSNGSGYTQAQALCAAMKAPGTDIEIYTVGLGLVGTPAAQNIMTQCASSASHVYLPETGGAMKDAFHDIAMKISKLRLSQ